MENEDGSVKRYHLLRILLKCSSTSERIVFAIAAAFSIGIGGGFPLLPVLFARTVSRFSKLYNPNFENFASQSEELDVENVTREVQNISQIMLAFGLAVALSTFLMAFLQIRTARNVSSRIRRMYFKSIMHQDVSWYHLNPAGELTARVSSIDKIERVMGQTTADFIRDCTTTIVGFILAFYNSWKMTLVIFSFMPAIALVGGIISVLSNRQSQNVQKAFGEASAASNESFSSLRTILSFEGRRTETSIYEKYLESIYKFQIRRAIIDGFGTGFLMLVLMTTFSVGFIVGSHFIATGQVTLDRAISASALVPAVFAAFRIANAQRRISAASAAAKTVLDVISTKPKIDPLSEEGESIKNFKGNISFENVSFNYQGKDKSKSNIVLHDLSFEMPSGSSNGLCGYTGR